MSEQKDAPFLRVDALSRIAPNGARVLTDVSFEIAKGERVALVGANGSGKTTTLRCVSRLLEDWSGSVELEGRSIREFSRRSLAQKIAFVQQDSALFVPFSVREIVSLGRSPFLRTRESLSESDERIVAEVLDRVSCRQFADRRFDSLSGGERRKVLLAAAFAQEPSLLLLDETTTFLDQRAQDEIADAVSQWLFDYNAAALETTHDLNRAALSVDRVVALRFGSVAYEGRGVDATSPDALSSIFDVPPPIVKRSDSDVLMILPRLPRAAQDARALGDNTQFALAPTRRSFPWLSLALVLLLAALVFLPLVGKTSYSPDVWLRFPTAERPLLELDSVARIFWGERLPKTLLASLVGASLALAGLALQTLFRNALATPYTLGVASGASFGASLSIQFAGSLAALGVPALFFGVPRVVCFAFLGAILATSLVGAFARRSASDERVLLSGVAIGFFFSSLILALQYFADPNRAFVAFRWTVGSLESCDGTALTTLALALALVSFPLMRLARELDVSLLGEERARALGVDPRRLRRALFVASSILVGTTVAFCGPIGFVGLVVPHIARLIVGASHRRLIPASLLGGALFLCVCHTISRIVIFPSLLPIGVVTSLVGAPFFLWLLARSIERR